MNATPLAIGLLVIAGGGSLAYRSAHRDANLPLTASEVKSYMTTMRSFLQTPPRGDVFGSERIPTLHNVEMTELAGYKEIEQFAKGNKVRSSLVGLNAFPENAKEGEPDSTYRISDVHTENYFDESNNGDDDYKAWDNITQQLLSRVEQSDRDKKEFAEYSVDSAHKAKIFTLAVNASEKSCYKCHKGKEGKPIGHLAVIIEKL